MRRFSADGCETQRLYCACVIIVFIIFIIFAAAGPRGSDQYWYMSDTEAIMRGHATSNSLWPYFIHNDSTYLESRYFVHATPSLWITASLGHFIGSYSAWIAINACASIITSGAIYFSCKNLGLRASTSAVAAALFLLMPVVFWQTSQPLLEPTVTMFVSMILYLASRVDHRNLNIMLAALTAIAAETTRSIFLPTIILLCAILLYRILFLHSEKKRIIPAVYLSIILAALIAAKAVFSDTLQMPIAALAMNGTSGKSLMSLWMSATPLNFDATAFLLKAMKQLSAYFELGQSQVFIIPVFALFAMIFVAMGRQVLESKLPWRNPNALIVLLSLLLAISTIVFINIVHQNQFRYLMMVLPPTLVAFAYYFDDAFEKLLKKFTFQVVALCVTFGFIVVQSALAWTLRKSSLSEKENLAAFTLQFEEISALKNQNFLLDCYKGGTSLAVAYAVPLQNFIHIDVEQPTADLQSLIRKTSARYVLCDPVSARELSKNLGVELEQIAKLQIGSQAIDVFRLQTSK